MNYGFVKVAAAVPHVKVADCKFNVEKIESLIAVAEGKRGANHPVPGNEHYGIYLR